MDGSINEMGISTDELVQDLDRLKLIIVFDALLVEGSLSRAAQKLGKTPSAISRILSQLRAHYGQELFNRTSKGMVPTAFAENLRPRIRALVSEANSLLAPINHNLVRTDPILPHPPLALNQWREHGFGPDAFEIAQRLAASSKDSDPTHRFAGYIALIGNGSGQTRPMNEAEAEDAMNILLSDNAAEVQVGAFLISLQSRGLTEQELAGFTRAARNHSKSPALGTGSVDLDWPAYLSPRTQGTPLFIHAARLVSKAGYNVLVHGFDGGIVHQAFSHAGLSVGQSANPLPNANGPAFLPVGTFAPGIRKLTGLYPLFMMPNSAQHITAMLNPGGASITLAGVRVGERPALQRDAARLLGWGTFAVLSGQRDAAQIVSDKGQDLFLLRDNKTSETRLTYQSNESITHNDAVNGLKRLEIWQAIWDGVVSPHNAVTSIIETAAVALNLLSMPETTMEVSRNQARELWAKRRK